MVHLFGKLGAAALLIAGAAASAQTGSPVTLPPATPSATASPEGAQAALTVDQTAETNAMIAAQNKAAAPARPKAPGTPGAAHDRAHEQPRNMPPQ